MFDVIYKVLMLYLALVVAMNVNEIKKMFAALLLAIQQAGKQKWDTK